MYFVCDGDEGDYKISSSDKKLSVQGASKIISSDDKESIQGVTTVDDPASDDDCDDPDYEVEEFERITHERKSQ